MILPCSKVHPFLALCTMNLVCRIWILRPIRVERSTECQYTSWQPVDWKQEYDTNTTTVLEFTRDISVGIATGNWLHVREIGVQFPAGASNFPFSTASRTPAPGSTQPSIQCVPGASFPRATLSGRETGHSPPWLRMVELYFRFPIRLNGLVPDTGTPSHLPLF
jgi:hypothetical protein